MTHFTDQWIFSPHQAVGVGVGERGRDWSRGKGRQYQIKQSLFEKDFQNVVQFCCKHSDFSGQ